MLLLPDTDAFCRAVGIAGLLRQTYRPFSGTDLERLEKAAGAAVYCFVG